MPDKIYSFSGLVDIGVNCISLNGASMRGNNPVGDCDWVTSAVSGAILRSTGQHVFLQNLLVVLGANATTAYDFSDATGTKSCNLISGNNVKQAAAVTSNAGVGQLFGLSGRYPGSELLRRKRRLQNNGYHGPVYLRL